MLPVKETGAHELFMSRRRSTVLYRFYALFLPLHFCYFFRLYICYSKSGHLNDIHACSKTIEPEAGQILQCKYLYNS